MKSKPGANGIEGVLADLTICSVYHSEMTSRVLEMNYDFSERLNPESKFLWLAADNSPKDSGIGVNKKKFSVVPGGEVPDFVPWYTRSGFQLGTALNSLRPHIKTRFALFLDYDFFMVRRGWISEILQYMRDKNLSFLGVPYHPKFYTKFRYFPSHHSLFVDTKKIPAGSLNFLPQYSKEELEKHTSVRERHRAASKGEAKRARSWVSKIIRDNLKKRLWIGSSKDVSYGIYQKFHGQKEFKYECFTPAISLKEIVHSHYFRSDHLKPLVYLIEKIMPDRWSFLPQKGYYTFTRFRDLGYPDAMFEGLEEYFWRGRPLGFHLRGFRQRQAENEGKEFPEEQKIELIKKLLEGFSGK